MSKSAIQLYLFLFMLLHSISPPGKFDVQAISPHGNQSEFLQSTRSQPSMPSPFCNRQVSPPDLSWPNGQTYGLARVARLRSSDLRGQTPWSDASLRMVTELLMRDALVLCLPPEVLEMQGRPSVNLQCAQVVAVVGAAVVCTYVPSTLLEPIGSASTPPTLTVGSILGRSNQAPTHPELGAAEHKYGIHFQSNRWRFRVGRALALALGTNRAMQRLLLHNRVGVLCVPREICRFIAIGRDGIRSRIQCLDCLRPCHTPIVGRCADAFSLLPSRC